jgi:cyanophycinase
VSPSDQEELQFVEVSREGVGEMTGYLLLEGGAEFGGRMAEPDLAGIALAGGMDAQIVIVPTAAAPDNNHKRAGDNGVRWFRSLGASRVSSVPLIDRASANQADVAASLRQARLVYLLGGFPRYLGQTLMGSLAWQAVLQAYASGAVIAGSSAGAMVLCSHYFDPGGQEIFLGLDLIPNACVLPHHNKFGKGWAERIGSRMPKLTLLGIDEHSGMLNSGPIANWQVAGGGGVTVYTPTGVTRYNSGENFSLPE